MNNGIENPRKIVSSLIGRHFRSEDGLWWFLGYYKLDFGLSTLRGLRHLFIKIQLFKVFSCLSGQHFRQGLGKLLVVSGATMMDCGDLWKTSDVYFFKVLFISSISTIFQIFQNKYIRYLPMSSNAKYFNMCTIEPT